MSPPLPRVVLDASVTLDWLLDENDGRARVGPALRSASLVAPTLWRLEVTNVLLVLERKRKLTSSQADQLAAVVDGLTIDLVPDPPTRTAASLSGLARPHRLTAYDATYLDLAIRLGLPLFTRDGNLRAAAARVGVPLVTEATP